MRRTLAGKRVVITGASSGIGRATAERLAREGARIALAARSADKLAEVERGIVAAGGEAFAVPTDVTSEADRERLLAAVVERWQGLDVLVNNAGIGSHGHFATSTEEILRTVMEVNFFAPAELIRLALPRLREGSEPAVVNVASVTGRKALPAFSEYSASKYALCGLTESLRGELARFDVDVVLVVPGVTATDGPRQWLRREGRMKIDHASGTPAEVVAEKVVSALRGGRRETVIGAKAKWLLRTHRLAPRLLDWLIRRRVRKLYA